MFVHNMVWTRFDSSCEDIIASLFCKFNKGHYLHYPNQLHHSQLKHTHVPRWGKSRCAEHQASQFCSHIVAFFATASKVSVLGAWTTRGLFVWGPTAENWVNLEVHHLQTFFSGPEAWTWSCWMAWNNEETIFRNQVQQTAKPTPESLHYS